VSADSLAVRLAALEDRAAIRALNLAFARHVNAGAYDALADLFADDVDVCTGAMEGGREGGPEGPPLRVDGLHGGPEGPPLRMDGLHGAVLRSVHGVGEDEVVEVAPDRLTARASVSCVAGLETPIGPSCPLVEMARAQGGGIVLRLESGHVDHEYVRRDGIWKIRRSTYRAGAYSPRA
jgi:hypothetical protein